MKNKELYDALEACGHKRLSETILEYLNLTEGKTERGIQQSLGELEMVTSSPHINTYGSYTEIGSAEGGSLWIYSNMLLHPGATINIIEPVIREALLITIEALKKKGFKVNLFVENNPTTAKTIGTTDVLMIDGDHSYLAVKKDFDTYFPIVKHVCLLHDTASFPGCIRLKNELKKKSPSSIVQINSDRCLHTMLDTFEETKKACIAKGHYDFFYKDLIPGTTLVFTS